MKITNHMSRILVMAFCGLVLTFNSCKKEKSELTEQEEEEIALASTQADAESENMFSDAFDDVMGVNNDVGMAGTGIFGGRTAPNLRGMNVDSVPPCVTVTVVHLSSTPFPVRITVDFGVGCVGRDGRMRSGKIISTYTGRLIDPGKSATTTFENYFVDSVKVEGTLVITNSTPPLAGPVAVRSFTFDVQGGKLTRPNGNYSEWNSHRVITQVEGLGTPLIALDDVFTITGGAKGTVKRGSLIVKWESIITEALRKRFACRWIVKGRVKISRVNLPSTSPWVAVLDYGNGFCDNNATLTVNGITHQITLH
jgi:hypothetical protein